MTADLVAMRAGALCIAAEPHRAPGEDWPCAACQKRVRSAAASSPVAGGSAAAVAGLDGVAGSEPPPVRAGGPS